MFLALRKGIPSENRENFLVDFKDASLLSFCDEIIGKKTEKRPPKTMLSSSTNDCRSAFGWRS